jgi:molybdopterin-guanine dinucleotide biosynthesis protein A
VRQRRLLGAVLAGGRSLRYGRPKHAEEVAGVSMVRRSVELLQGILEHVVVVSSRPVEGVDPASVIPDLVQDRGPVGGLHAALHHAARLELEGVLLLACDLPLVDAGVVRALIGAGSGAVAAPARGKDGIEPLCAVYGLEALPAVDRRVASRDLSLHALFREVGGLAVSLDAEAFLNVNTPGDRDRAEAAMKERASK